MRTLPHSGKPQQDLHRQRGCSLIELLIVVAIILIIAAIAIPNLLHAKIAANEAAAEVIRTITTVSVTYSSTYRNGYPPALGNLGGPAGGVSTCNLSVLMDNIIAAAPSQTSGFTFAYTAFGTPVTAVPGCTMPGANAHLVTATPISEFVTGIRSFCSDEPGTLHYDTTGATAGSQNARETLPALQWSLHIAPVLIHNRSPGSSILLRFHSWPFRSTPSISPRSSRLTRLFLSPAAAKKSHLLMPPALGV
jgi:type IV pilus assembly protein PilA